jgi:hypothetical protein
MKMMKPRTSPPDVLLAPPGMKIGTPPPPPPELREELLPLLLLRDEPPLDRPTLLRLPPPGRASAVTAGAARPRSSVNKSIEQISQLRRCIAARVSLHASAAARSPRGILS